MFMAYSEEFSCKKLDASIGEWEIGTPGRANHLPCQHLMFIAERVHHFENLPGSAIKNRWDMVAMTEMEKELQAGVASLQTVQSTMRTASDSFMHDGLTQPTMRKATQEVTQADRARQGATFKTTQEATHAKVGYENEQSSSKTTRPQFQSKRRVIYVKIRRRERANVVVMSAEEKYCYAKAVFEPVMEHLSELASPAFCSALQKWKEIVRKGLRGSVVSYSNMSDATTSPDESNEGDGGDEWDGSDADSDIGPTELIDTMNTQKVVPTPELKYFVFPHHNLDTTRGKKLKQAKLIAHGKHKRLL
ncbi:Hypothetical protein PHPALM_3504 [Phytophthora palmivora]|uniref:Uncharacterized protein n=1 Tax=Phytophthora palmivora TaxID=4796 RepID=A0A2P4YM79_9STRA|nr:Hypothetical protein PHPALM_3504 [Phytophthora palmivora]